MTALITDDQVRAHVTMDRCIDAVESAFAAAGRGGFSVSERKVVAVEGGARLLSLTAGSGELGMLVANVYSGAPAGQSKTSSSVNRRQKLYLLYAADTGECVAIIGGATLSRLKTGAMGAVAIKHLADPRASTLGIIGSGRQARVALAGALAVRDFDDVRVWSPTREHAERFAADCERSVRVTADPETTVRGADVVITATTSHSPVLHGEWLSEGTHVNSIGAHYPSHRELDTAAISRATVFVDTLVAARAEKGELLLAEKEGAFDFSEVIAELGAVVAGAAEWTRSPRDVTVFASCGSAIESLGAAMGALESVPAVEVATIRF